jgi:signal peptidase II
MFCACSKTGLRWLWIALLVVLLDRITKYCAQKYLLAYSAVSVFPFFNFTLAYNKGAAFSFLNYASGWQVELFGVIAFVVSIALIIWLYRLSFRQRWLSIALSLIAGGALGNLWDRLAYGQVIDFLDFHAGHWHWPVFNIADSTICIGAFMLFCDAVLRRKAN